MCCQSCFRLQACHCFALGMNCSSLQEVFVEYGFADDLEVFGTLSIDSIEGSYRSQYPWLSSCICSLGTDSGLRFRRSRHCMDPQTRIGCSSAAKSSLNSHLHYHDCRQFSFCIMKGFSKLVKYLTTLI